MRALVLSGAVVFVLAGAAGAANSARQLTLNAPRATRFGHVVDLTGRLSPVAPGTRVSLLRGKTFIAATAVRNNGAYKLQVSLGRPGPFHTVAGAVSSKPVTVRIHPILKTKLVGTRVAGEPLAVVARLTPAEAGRVRVRVIRDSGETYRGSFLRRARVRLGTTAVSPFRVAVDLIPAAGYASASREIHVALRAPALALGSRGPIVSELLRRLAALGYASPSARTVFDEDVLQAVYAFEKAQDLPRTGVASAAFWHRLAKPVVIVPRYRSPASHLEIDKRRQILMVVRDGRVALVVPVSTAGIAGYFTPVGRFAISRKIPGYDTSPLGVLYKPMYFYGGYAIHGNPSVPPYPASHGCIRVPNFMIDRLYDTEPYGEAVVVY